MLKHIHQLIIEPNATVRLVCKDGLSAATVYNIDKIYHFGGNLKFVDCGAGAIYAGLYQASGNMLDKYGDIILNLDGDKNLADNCDAYKPEDFPDHKTFATTVDLCRAYESNRDDLNLF